MATTYPSSFPEHLIADREPEKRVFDALSLLPDGYIVIYSLSWHEDRGRRALSADDRLHAKMQRFLSLDEAPHLPLLEGPRVTWGWEAA